MNGRQVLGGLSIVRGVRQQSVVKAEGAKVYAAADRIVSREGSQAQKDAIVAVALWNVAQILAGAEHEIECFYKKRLTGIARPIQYIEAWLEGKIHRFLARTEEADEAQLERVERHQNSPGCSGI